MLFSSSVFLFLFLPAVLAGYYALPSRARKTRNLFLTFASLFFYAWGEPLFVLVMLASIVANWLFGLLAGGPLAPARRRLLLAAAVAFNLSFLFVFKYLSFAVANLDAAFGLSLPVPRFRLPLGISFFTFQALSYVVDVSRGIARPRRNILDVAFFISFFPQLVAGPIVRYNSVADQIDGRRESPDLFFGGFSRFVAGLAKKVLLANSLAVVADRAFDGFASGAPLSSLGAWLGALCYAMQIFCDFSGYSDMAIGLGAMFGFRFPENFDHPYASTSISEFWRRWHISLGTWFRDYVYIPLGGSRVSRPRLLFNLFVVWLLTGVWHGANWTFVAWGLLYFLLLAFEKLSGFGRSPSRAAKPFLWLYSSFFVLLGWVLFRSPSLSSAARFLSVMFGRAPALADAAFFADLRQAALFLVFAALCAFPCVPRRLAALPPRPWTAACSALALFSLFLLSVAGIVSSSYNPFIYFNF